MKKKYEDTFLNKYGWPIVVGFGIVMLWLLTPKIASSLIGNCVNYERLGQFGDMFGSINALFSGLTIAFLVYTIILQRREREAGKRDADDQKKREGYQRYENFFFKLLDLHLKLYEQLNDSFAHFEKDIIGQLTTQPGKDYSSKYKAEFETKDVARNFGNYLKTFEFIVNTILRKKGEDTRAKYFKLYFAQLHVNEKRFLLYHFNFGSEKPDEWDLVKKYLFDGFSPTHIDNSQLRGYRFDGLPDPLS